MVGSPSSAGFDKSPRVGRRQRLVIAIVSLVCLLGIAHGAGAQGTNGRPLPFEPGYFPAYNSPQVVASNSDVEVRADDLLTISFPLDRHIVRTIMVKNIFSDRIRVEYAPSITIPGYAEEGFISHPQPYYLYLEPGQSHPIRLTYEIGVSPATQGWQPGDHINAPMSLSLQMRRATGGNTSALQITLTNVVDVVAPDQFPPPAATLPGPAPNATITGSVFTASTNQPYANGALILDSSWGAMQLTTNANGQFTANVFAYQRAGAGAWREFYLRQNGVGAELAPQHVVVAVAGQSTPIAVTVPAAAPALSYQVTGSLVLDLQAYDWDASADGSVFATVPFHTGLSPEAVAPKAFVTVFDGSGALLFKFPLIGETPAIDVSDDGSLIAATRQTAVGFTAFSAIVLNRSGQLVREVQPQDTPTGWGVAAGAYSYVEVRLSHDNRYLALGDAVGRVVLVDMATGNELWRAFPGGQVRFIEFDTNDARIFVSSGDGYLRAYALDGTLQWRTWVDSWLTAMDISEHFILASAKSIRGALHLIDKVTGATRWSYGVDSRATSVRIAPDESFVWYGTTSGVMRNMLFSIDGTATTQLTRAGAANAGVISADSQRIAYKTELPNASGIGVSDRLGRSLFSTTLNQCSGTANQMLWMSADSRRLAVAVGDCTPNSGRVYFLTRSGASPQPFTDNTLVANTTRVRAVHITELRTRINAQRLRFNLLAAAFTDDPLTTDVTGLKGIHITELRAALAAAYVAAGFTAPSFTDSTLAAGTTAIKRIHIQELRDALTFLELQ